MKREDRVSAYAGELKGSTMWGGCERAPSSPGPRILFTYKESEHYSLLSWSCAFMKAKASSKQAS